MTSMLTIGAVLACIIMLVLISNPVLASSDTFGGVPSSLPYKSRME